MNFSEDFPRDVTPGYLIFISPAFSAGISSSGQYAIARRDLCGVAQLGILVEILDGNIIMISC